MPSCNQLSTVVREEVVAGAGKKGFFRRIAEIWGLAQKEVIDCRGKSLSEFARMTSKKDGVVLLLDSIESKEEIDVERAKSAKSRAEERLNEPLNIDIERASKALARALNRIAVYENDD